MTAAATAAVSRTRIGTAVIPLAALAVFINYVDRGNLATAAPLIKDELKLDASQLGLLISAFSWTYVAAMPLAGWFAERIGACRAMALGLGLWSVATLVTGLAGDFVLILLMRLALGVGESVAFPCSSKLIAENVAHQKLGGANALVSLGISLGPAFGVLFGGLLMATLGWRQVFLLFGALSLFWLAPWLLATRRSHPAVKGEQAVRGAPPFLSILKRRELWGAALGQFGAIYAFYFIAAWMPLYLVSARGYSLSAMAIVSGAVYLLNASAALASGWLSDRWMAAGASANRVRKTLLIGGHLGLAAALLVCATAGASVSVAALFVSSTFSGAISPQMLATSQHLAGARAAGKWVGVQNCIANMSGVIGPIVTGMIIDRMGGFDAAFMVSAGVSLAGVLGWALLIPKIEPVDWRLASAQVS